MVLSLLEKVDKKPFGKIFRVINNYVGMKHPIIYIKEWVKRPFPESG